MKKNYRLNNLGCANCASKMEREIGKLDGVNSATVNFMMQKLTIDAVDEGFDDVMASVQKIIKKIEPDCIVKM
ncbi:Heavy metal transport/detoxification protein [Ruminiclostridium papyrosolvens DSM 2782]|uniref:Heavy metal transport/detoxification protein n=1 Tax=Ruminiclostridium papyrosolvens DSM 2782 TaxID=588581 RepID=F1TE70_9FIRM|nr:heavy metal-associated domain-containing protein [Ruminiclostridium papyrosolvens]EGD47310.1 Heavy metal transport/detoxification protein [Ruminiclostridium papyrosolvens DSM 2782]WES34656.1 heavy metal-associated domain-containing protein [Ruminiclostridium papyrosolvens DSM 2782]